MEPKKVLHITNIASLYRQAQWSKLLAHPRLDYHFAFGDNPYAGIKTIDFSVSPFTKFKASLHGIKNIWVFKKFLVWQRGVIGKCLKTNANLVILLGEFNVLSNWIGALICRIRKVPVVFRGHGMYGNEKGLKLFLRKNYYKLANGHLVYERRSKKIMVSHGFKAENIHIIFNSLDYDAHREARERIKNLDKAEIYPFFKNPEAPVLLFVGRLTTVKKLHLFLEAVAILNKKGHYPNILIVGDGPEGPELKKYATQHLKEGYYHFYGACYNEKTNEKLLAAADVCVSPGNVGLTAIHNLSYGTPVITHGNFENQMPEVEAITEGETGYFFEEGNVTDLSEKILRWISQPNYNREAIRQKCYEIIDEYYNPYYQIEVIENLANQAPALL